MTNTELIRALLERTEKRLAIMHDLNEEWTEEKGAKVHDLHTANEEDFKIINMLLEADND